MDGADWTKGNNAWHTAARNATRTNEEVLERWERRRGERVFSPFVCLLVFDLNFLKFSFDGDTSGMRGRYERLEDEWNWCIM